MLSLTVTLQITAISKSTIHYTILSTRFLPVIDVG